LVLVVLHLDLELDNPRYWVRYLDINTDTMYELEMHATVFEGNLDLRAILELEFSESRLQTAPVSTFK
jgi:hypothetical protein